MKVQIFVPCFIDQVFPETAVNMVQILRKAGCEVFYNEAQTCCGQPAFNAGFWEEAREVSAKFLDDMQRYDMPIVIPSGSCTGFVRNYQEKIFENERLFRDKSVRLQPKIYEFTEFLVHKLGQTDFGASLPAKATYHDACAALRECQIKEAPRKLLEQVQGLELVEAEDAEVCCGFGGSFAIKYEPISTAMAEQKIQHALDLGAEYIVSTDLSCLMHLKAFIEKKQLPLKIAHIADILTMEQPVEVIDA